MTRRRLIEPKIVVATHNAGKLREIRELLAPFSVEAVSAGELGLPEPEETGTTYAENARIKADAAAQASGLPALADDSGISVFALWGAPGIFSARWGGPEKNFDAAMARVAADLDARGARDAGQRRAAFVAALCLAWPDGHVEQVEGAVEGCVVWPPRGSQGFGYDPIFRPDGHSRTFGEMSAEEKHGITWEKGRGKGLSHRARAFAALAARCLPEPKET